MAGGKPRKPKALKILTNTLQKCRTPPELDVSPAYNIHPPDYFNNFARDVWDCTIPALESMGLIGEADVKLIEAYCQEMGVYIEMQYIFKKVGRFVEGKYGQMEHPGISVAERALKLAGAIGGRFGITPAERAKVAQIPTKPKSKMAALRDGS